MRKERSESHGMRAICILFTKQQSEIKMKYENSQHELMEFNKTRENRNENVI